MYITASQSYNGISSGPSSSTSSGRCGTFRGGRKVVKAPAYAFILPNLEQYPEDFRRFLERDIIEISILRRLESSGHLNWWCPHDSNQKLWPLVTTGDGNCLLHAASLGIWGVHDRQLNLRNTLHDVLKHGSRKHAIYRRWRWNESKSNLQSELVLTEEEWRREWSAVLELASPTPRQNPSENSSSAETSSQQEQIYESLECIHVFALAHILKRPIIVVADTILRNANGEELAPIPFGGIYLPLECPPEQCHRSPLLLCFDQSHFSALVAMRQTISTNLQVIPITDKNRNLLPVHFSVDPGADFTWWRDNDDFRIASEIEAIQSDDRRMELIGRYMDIVRMDLRRGSVRKTVPMPFANDVNGAMPSVPNKLLTLAAGRTDSPGNMPSPRHSGFGSSSILKEIRQHFRWIGRKSRRKSSTGHPFSAAELLQSNYVLTVLLHNYAHQYIDSMVSLYIANARERFERAKLMPPSLMPKNRLSRSFSTSSVLLTCLSTHCQRVASPSTNFLCDACFEAQKRELTRTLMGSVSISSNLSGGGGEGMMNVGNYRNEEARRPEENGIGTHNQQLDIVKQSMDSSMENGDGAHQNQQFDTILENGHHSVPKPRGMEAANSSSSPPPLPPKKPSFHRHQPSYDSGLSPIQMVTGDYCLEQRNFDDRRIVSPTNRRILIDYNAPSPPPPASHNTNAPLHSSSRPAHL